MHPGRLRLFPEAVPELSRNCPGTHTNESACDYPAVLNALVENWDGFLMETRARKSTSGINLKLIKPWHIAKYFSNYAFS
jgi:hypothetical protein